MTAKLREAQGRSQGADVGVRTPDWLKFFGHFYQNSNKVMVAWVSDQFIVTIVYELAYKFSNIIILDFCEFEGYFWLIYDKFL